MARSTKKLASLFTVSALAVGLAACGSDEGSSGNGEPPVVDDPAALETTIKILAPAYADSTKVDWEAIIEEFNKEYPNVTVELQVQGWDDYSSKVQARIQANDYPDILNDNQFASVADAGILYPIDEVLSAETLDSIEPALNTNGLGADGTQWAVPDVASARMMAVNTDVLAAAGVEIPTTWEELEATCEAIKATNPDVYPYGMPLGQEEAQVEASLWLWGAGGDWTVDGELTATSPEAEEAFTEMQKLIDNGCTQPNAGSSNRQDVADLFNNGKVAMMMSHSGLLGITAADYPEINFDVAPVPSKDGEGVALGVTDFIVAFDNGDEDRKAATAAFLDLFYSDDMYKNWYAPSGLLPVTKTIIEEGKAGADEVNTKFYEGLSTVQFLPVGNPAWDILQGALQSTAGKITSEAPNAVLEEIQALVDAQS